MKKILFSVVVIFSLYLLVPLHDYHVELIHAIPYNDVRIVRSIELEEGSNVVLFEDKTTRSFGIVKIETKFGFLYKWDFGIADSRVDEGEPFHASGLVAGDELILAVKTAQHSRIVNIVLSPDSGIEGRINEYELSLAESKPEHENYKQEIKNGYALYVLNGQDLIMGSATITAFDQKGHLVVKESIGGDVDFIDIREILQ
ncbi:hypothetical protein [Bacillus sp. AK128]